MGKEKIVIQKIKQQGILPLFYNRNADVCLSVIKTLYNAGIRCIEFTNRGQDALKNFKQIVKTRNIELKDLFLGAGTIKTGTEAQNFIDAGADFLVSPVFDSGVYNIASQNETLWIPGCATPTEIHNAEKADCRFIKLFPGSLLGVSFVEAIRPLFPGLDFAITGGVNTSKENMASWFNAGVCAVGLGSNLISQKIMDTKDFSTLESDARKVLEIIQHLKK